MKEENNNIELPKTKEEVMDSIELPKTKEEIKEENNNIINEENYEIKIEKQKEKNSKKNMFYNICYAFVFICLFVWLGIWFYEYQNVSKGNEPKFCLTRETINHDDGKVEICSGIGYRVINYQRESYKAIEMGPFWIKERDNLKK